MRRVVVAICFAITLAASAGCATPTESTPSSPRKTVTVYASASTTRSSSVPATATAAAPPTTVETGTTAVAPNPAPPQTQTPTTTNAAPIIGQSCIGADIGRTAIDPNGTAIVCDDYQWVPNTGQTPRHPWADDQREWTECIATHTTDECREILGTG